jgi:hypothetical protein
MQLLDPAPQALFISTLTPSYSLYIFSLFTCFFTSITSIEKSMPKVVIIKRLLVDPSIIIRPSIIKPNHSKLSVFFQSLSLNLSISLSY